MRGQVLGLGGQVLGLGLGGQVLGLGLGLGGQGLGLGLGLDPSGLGLGLGLGICGLDSKSASLPNVFYIYEHSTNGLLPAANHRAVASRLQP